MVLGCSFGSAAAHPAVSGYCCEPGDPNVCNWASDCANNADCMTPPFSECTALAPDVFALEPESLISAGIKKARFITVRVTQQTLDTQTGIRVEAMNRRTGICCQPDDPESCLLFVCRSNEICFGKWSECRLPTDPFVGEVRYVNSFEGSLSCPDSIVANTHYICGRLGCQPEYRDWASDVAAARKCRFGSNNAQPCSSSTDCPGGSCPDTLLHITGNLVIPDAEYDVTVIDATCGPAPGAESCPSISPYVPVSTTIWGDACRSAGGPPDGMFNVVDVGCTIDSVKDLGGRPPEIHVWHKGRDPEPLLEPINVIDVGSVVDGLKYRPYPHGIDLCP